MKKGLTKHWIEIIGGVIIVAIILLVILLFGTSISTAVEDAQAINSFREVKASMRDASTSGLSSIGDFRLETSVEGRYYAIAYVPHLLTRCWLGSDEGVCENQPIVDQSSARELRKCYDLSEMQAKGEYNDICMCVVRVDPAVNSRHDYHVYLHNLFGIERHGDSHSQDIASINLGWQDVIFPVFEARGFRKSLAGMEVEEARLKVLDCSMVIRDIGCSYYYEDGPPGNFPCMLRYNNHNLYWIMGGRHDTSWWRIFSSGKMPFNQEVLNFKKDSDEGHIIHVETTSPIDSIKMLENFQDWPVRGRVVSLLRYLYAVGHRRNPSGLIETTLDISVTLELTHSSISTRRFHHIVYLDSHPEGANRQCLESNLIHRSSPCTLNFFVEDNVYNFYIYTRTFQGDTEQFYIPVQTY